MPSMIIPTSCSSSPLSSLYLHTLTPSPLLSLFLSVKATYIETVNPTTRQHKNLCCSNSFQMLPSYKKLTDSELVIATHRVSWALVAQSVRVRTAHSSHTTAWGLNPFMRAISIYVLSLSLSLLFIWLIDWCKCCLLGLKVKEIVINCMSFHHNASAWRW